MISDDVLLFVAGLAVGAWWLALSALLYLRYRKSRRAPFAAYVFAGITGAVLPTIALALIAVLSTGALP